jgi:antitoxin ParD1/3/4
MNITLTPQLEEMVRRRVASGDYSDANEVIHEALRIMEERERERLDALRAALAVGQEQLDRGEGAQYSDDSLAKIIQRSEAKLRQGHKPKHDVRP